MSLDCALSLSKRDNLYEHRVSPVPFHRARKSKKTLIALMALAGLAARRRRR